MIACKTVMTYSQKEKKIRLWRFLFGDLQKGCNGYFAKYSIGISLVPELFRWRNSVSGWEITIFCLRVHLKRGLGGWCV